MNWSKLVFAAASNPAFTTTEGQLKNGAAYDVEPAVDRVKKRRRHARWTRKKSSILSVDSVMVRLHFAKELKTG